MGHCCYVAWPVPRQLRHLCLPAPPQAGQRVTRRTRGGPSTPGSGGCHARPPRPPQRLHATLPPLPPSQHAHRSPGAARRETADASRTHCTPPTYAAPITCTRKASRRRAEGGQAVHRRARPNSSQHMEPALRCSRRAGACARHAARCHRVHPHACSSCLAALRAPVSWRHLPPASLPWQPGAFYRSAAGGALRWRGRAAVRLHALPPGAAPEARTPRPCPCSLTAPPATSAPPMPATIATAGLRSGAAARARSARMAAAKQRGRVWHRALSFGSLCV